MNYRLKKKTKMSVSIAFSKTESIVRVKEKSRYSINLRMTQTLGVINMPIIIKDGEGKDVVVSKTKNVKAPGFSETYATGVQGGAFGPYDFRLVFFEQRVEPDEKTGELYEVHEVRQSIVVPYATAKQLSIWLKNHLDEYEKMAGHEIYIGEKIK
ncbi:MAG: DUF3467 domain-containing protein [Methanothrix sp.]|nr:DUF3467 domain-containing protein [Methanothrix sp.]